MRHAEKRLRVIRLLLVWQLCSAVFAGIVGLYWGMAAATGALAGGLIVWLPNCYFAFRAFRFRGARAARQIVRSFYAGAAGKMLLSAALFTLVFVNLRPLNAAAVFLGFAFVQAVNWIVPLAIGRGDSERGELNR
ncbi:MAG: ATP synthase subunit I [Granulosicoccus sp.]